MSPLLPIRPAPFNNIRVASAKGATLTTVDGQELIDFTSGFGVAALGYSHPKLVEAITTQITRVSHAIPSLIGFAGDDKAANDILDCVGDRGAAAVITTSGSEAIEVALKAAHLATSRPGLVVVDGAYHGQSLGVLPASSQTAFSDPFRQLLRRHARVLPYCGPVQSADDRSSSEIQALSMLASWLEERPDSPEAVGAVMVEPMQNLSGYRSFSPTFASSLTNLCRSKNVLLIADEVFTGFGRCGNWRLAETQGFTPDIAVYGKALTGGIPGGVCVADRELLGHLYPRNGPPLHAPTFFNAPVVCAAMSSSIDILRSESLLPRSTHIGERLARALLPLMNSLTGVGAIRGHGAAQAIEFYSHDGSASGPALALTMCRNLLRLGVLALNSGFPCGNVVTLCPPLVISDVQLDVAIEKIQEALTLTANGREYG